MSWSTACLQPVVVSLCIVKYCHLQNSLCHELSEKNGIGLVLLFWVQYLDIWMTLLCFSAATKYVTLFFLIWNINVSSKQQKIITQKWPLLLFNIWFASVEVWTLRSFFSWKLWQQSDWWCLVFIVTRVYIHATAKNSKERKQEKTQKKNRGIQKNTHQIRYQLKILNYSAVFGHINTKNKEQKACKQAFLATAAGLNYFLCIIFSWCLVEYFHLSVKSEREPTLLGCSVCMVSAGEGIGLDWKLLYIMCFE